MTPSPKATSRSRADTITTPVSRRSVVVTGVVLFAIAAIAINSAVRTDGSNEKGVAQATSTTKAPEPALVKLDEELSAAVNLSVAFAGSVQVLDRELRSGAITGSELSRRAVAYEDQVTQSLAAVKELSVPSEVMIVKKAAIEAMELYLVSTRLLQGANGEADTARSGLSVRVKLLADRMFDRARISLDIATYGAVSTSGQRVLASPAIPDFAAEAPDTGTNPGIAPASERFLSEESWKAEVRRQAKAIVAVIDQFEWKSPSDRNEETDTDITNAQRAIVRSTDALAVNLSDFSLTEASRTLRIACAIIEQALTARNIGATTQALDLLEIGLSIWAIGATHQEVPKSLGTS